tara:strand:+ start:386 stop:643 length:258 start_codon:yes stop_codon:yes gene_type:complete
MASEEPQISLLLRSIERDLSAAVERAESDSEPRSTARLAHLMAAADLGLIAQELADREEVEMALMLLAYELGRALGPSTTLTKPE